MGVDCTRIGTLTESPQLAGPTNALKLAYLPLILNAAALGEDRESIRVFRSSFIFIDSRNMDMVLSNNYIN